MSLQARISNSVQANETNASNIKCFLSDGGKLLV